ncbi:cysteine-rich repeat secretory protein 38 [Jatropha curcas]|uniref:cysteine-rich repeat secretory protein 38 n=1 Tax=Jatropha curcas TaxID=180498 RepID=UPI0018938238|nr:cysteine-rich repeat secretory protein 38 [Jatropha curcas]
MNDALNVRNTHFTISVFSQENYADYGHHRNSLNGLLNLLSTKTPATGFGLASTGPPRGRGHVNALALCRGDVAKKDCKTCVANAGDALIDRCSNNKGAIIWYDDCLLKYSNFNFFGDIDEQNKFYLYNYQDVEKMNPALFNKKVKELLSGLSGKAYGNKKFYATGELKLFGGKYKKIYGMAQCTRDLSNMECKKCLDDAINELPSCCSGKKGARVVTGSCNVRYKLYPFVNVPKVN